MQVGASDSWADTFDAVARQPEPVSWKELVDRGGLDRDPSTIHRHLTAMVKAGLLEKQGQRKDARYWPRETVEIRWVARLGQHWRRLEWIATPPLDWRFPLASRVPDAEGRRTVLRLLEEMERRRLLSWSEQVGAWLQEAKGKKGPFENWPGGAQREVERLARRDRRPTVIVYGSCARGDARPESDVDVLVIAPDTPYSIEFNRETWTLPGFASERALRDIATDINLGSARPLDVLRTENSEVADLPGGLQQAIARDGVTVYGMPGPDFAEAWREA